MIKSGLYEFETSGPVSRENFFFSFFTFQTRFNAEKKNEFTMIHREDNVHGRWTQSFRDAWPFISWKGGERGWRSERVETGPHRGPQSKKDIYPVVKSTF